MLIHEHDFEHGVLLLAHTMNALKVGDSDRAMEMQNGNPDAACVHEEAQIFSKKHRLCLPQVLAPWKNDRLRALPASLVSFSAAFKYRLEKHLWSRSHLCPPWKPSSFIRSLTHSSVHSFID